MLDGRIVADIEVEKRMLLETPPIAAIHSLVITHIEGACDNLAAAFSQHQAKILGKTLLQLVKKFLRQILPAVVKPVDMAFVQAEHGAQMFLREFLALVGANRDAALCHLA